MLLTIDLGNTNLTIGLYQGETLVHHWRLATDQTRMPDEYGLQLLGLLTNAGRTRGRADRHLPCSVVPQLTGRIVQACREYLKQEPLVVDTGVKTGIRIRYEDPKAVGADRVADAVAVMHLYGGPACIIDFGTATTFNALTKEGDYLGGAITAGINLAAEALFTHAAKLPRIDLQKPPSVIGQEYHPCHAVGLDLWLRRLDRGYGGTFSTGTWSPDEDHCHRRPGRAGSQRNTGHPDPCPLADPRWTALDLGTQPPLTAVCFCR